MGKGLKGMLLPLSG